MQRRSAPVPVEVRPARHADLAAMDAAVPAAGGWNRRRLERHLAGRTVLLLAFDGDECLGRAEVLLDGPGAKDVQLVHPETPEVNGVEVAAARRGQGIGHALIAAAARIALEHGHRRLGIGVAPENSGARKLYEGLGFTGSLPYADPHAVTEGDAGGEIVDRCVFLTADVEDVLDRATT